jgi:hypothetical protein
MLGITTTRGIPVVTFSFASKTNHAVKKSSKNQTIKPINTIPKRPSHARLSGSPEAIQGGDLPSNAGARTRWSEENEALLLYARSEGRQNEGTLGLWSVRYHGPAQGF